MNKYYVLLSRDLHTRLSTGRGSEIAGRSAGTKRPRARRIKSPTFRPRSYQPAPHSACCMYDVRRRADDTRTRLFNLSRNTNTYEVPAV